MRVWGWQLGRGELPWAVAAGMPRGVQRARVAAGTAAGVFTGAGLTSAWAQVSHCGTAEGEEAAL